MMDSSDSLDASHEEIKDFLCLPTEPMVITYVIFLVKDVGLNSWLALTGLATGRESDLRCSLVVLLNDTGLVCPGAPTDKTIDALIRVIAHAGSVVKKEKSLNLRVKQISIRRLGVVL